MNKAQIKALLAPLDPDHVTERSKGNFSLSYVEGWHVIAEANRIFGFASWNRQTEEMEMVHEPYQNEKRNWVVSYRAKVRVNIHTDDVYVTREGSGFGSGFDAQIGQAHESAIKEAETDAMKRALMTFGNPFGLALYDKSKKNVKKPAGKMKLKTAMRDFNTDLQSVEDEDALNDLLESTKELQATCEVELPDWWYGSGDIDGAEDAIEKRREKLTEGN